jgi:hypothetical protein
VSALEALHGAPRRCGQDEFRRGARASPHAGIDQPGDQARHHITAPVTKRPALILPAVVVGLLLIALAVLYFVDSAGALPAFIPGHEAGSPHHHAKHGIAALLLGLGCLIYAWFQTGPTPREPRSGARGVDWTVDETFD